MRREERGKREWKRACIGDADRQRDRIRAIETGRKQTSEGKTGRERESERDREREKEGG